MGKKRKQRLCHICKKRPIWIGGDVKNPGPVCKRCYHEQVWPERLKRGGRTAEGSAAAEPNETVATKLGSNLRVSRSKRWIAAMRRYRLTLEELAMAQATNFEPRLMHKVATGQSVKRGGSCRPKPRGTRVGRSSARSASATRLVSRTIRGCRSRSRSA